MGTETYGGCVVSIVADADEGLVVLIGALDDSRRCPLSVCVRRRLVRYGDTMPGEILLRVCFDDGLLCSEPGDPNLSQSAHLATNIGNTMPSVAHLK